MNAQYFYQEHGGAVRGPLEIKVIDVAAKSGRLSREVMISESGRDPWAPLELVLRSGHGAFQMVVNDARIKADNERLRAAEAMAEHPPLPVKTPPVMMPMTEMRAPVSSACARYKVVTQKDKWFSGKFDPALLEQLLNELAADGWRVVSMVSASREGVLTGGGKDELIVLLEK